MTLLQSISALTLSLFIASLPAAAVAGDHHHQTKRFKRISLSDDLLMLQGKGGNIAVLKGSDGMLLVDDDYKDLSDALKKELNDLGGLDQLKYIVNTHWHGDHTEGNLALGKYATIVAHNNVRQRLLSKQEIKLFNMVSEPYPKEALPSVTYTQRLSLYMNDEEISLIHFAGGHTDGDSIVFFKAHNVVHMGDHFFNGFFPFVDLDSGGNVLTLAKNIQAVLSMLDDKTQIIPGHGGLANKKDLIAFHDMLVGTAAEVAAMKKQGLSLKAAQKQGLSERWNSWTNGFLSADVWVSLVYNSL